MSTQPTSYYVRIGKNRFQPTSHTGGAWRTTEQHMAPAAGLLINELMRYEPREDMHYSRFAFEILGTIHFDEVEIKVETLRPGRTIELVQAEMFVQGRVCIRLSAWRLMTGDSTPVAVIHDETMRPIDECVEGNQLQDWNGGWIASLTTRHDPDLVRKPGRYKLWMTHPYDLVEGEKTDPMVKILSMADTANGVAPAMDPSSSGFGFPNIDMQLHLYRQPTGSWLGVDATVNVGTEGVGLTSAVLSDENGPFGRSEQILTIRQVPGV